MHRAIETAILAEVKAELEYARQMLPASMTPIERDFFYAFMMHARFLDGEVQACVSQGGDFTLHSDVKDRPLWPDSFWPRRATIRTEMPVLTYRADFAINFLVGSYAFDADRGDTNGLRQIVLQLPTIIVECDGHDFHERTPEQAMHDRARDRAMTTAGYRVMRFTGREIHRDALACVKQVWDLADNIATTYGRATKPNPESGR